MRGKRRTMDGIKRITTVLLCASLIGCGAPQSSAKPTPALTKTPQPEATKEVEVTETPRPTEEPKATATPEPAQTEAPQATATPEPVPTEMPTPTAPPTSVPGDLAQDAKDWEARLQEFSDSAYDLTVPLTMESLQEQCEDYFLLGAAMSGGSYSTFAIHSEEFLAVLEKHFGSTTATNLMKPSYFLNQSASKKNYAAGNPEPAVDFSKIEETLEWCMDSGVKMRGHTLVWHNQTPDWFFRDGYTSDGEYVDRETMIVRLDSYIGQVMTYCQENYPGVVYCWDVVNEAVDPEKGDATTNFYCRKESGSGENKWYLTIGPDYVEQAFRSARKYADEDVKLFYNDYSVVDAKKRQYIYNLCKDLADQGLIDGIGLQGYWGTGWPSLSTIESTIRKLSELGVEIQLTELTIEAEPVNEIGYAAQAKRYADIFKLLQRLDTEGGGPANITAVTMFGLMDGYMYNQNDTNTSRWFDKNLQPKPVVEAVMEVFKEYY